MRRLSSLFGDCCTLLGLGPGYLSLVFCEGSDRLRACGSCALGHGSDPSYGAPHRKHEWDKHGTCAAQVDALNSEKKYFGKSLDLYKQIDLNRCVDIALCDRPGAGPLVGFPASSLSVMVLKVVWWAHF